MARTGICPVRRRPLLNRELHSERLWYRPVAAADVPALHDLWTHARVRRFLWDGRIIPVEQTREIVEASTRRFADDGCGLWGIREQGSHRLLGFAGYWYFRTPPVRELLYGVAADRWDRGLATESGRRIIRYGFEELELASVEASTDVSNTASVRVLEKLRMQRTGRAIVDGLDTVFYELHREEWQPAG